MCYGCFVSGSGAIEEQACPLPNPPLSPELLSRERGQSAAGHGDPVPATGHAYSAGHAASDEHWAIADKDFTAPGSHGSGPGHGPAGGYDVRWVIPSEPATTATALLPHEPHDDGQPCSGAAGTEPVQPQRHAQPHLYRCLLPHAVLARPGQHALPLLRAHALPCSHGIGVLGPPHQLPSPEALHHIRVVSSSCAAPLSHFHAFPSQPWELAVHPCWPGSPRQQSTAVPCVLCPGSQPLQAGHADGLRAGAGVARQPGASRPGFRPPAVTAEAGHAAREASGGSQKCGQ